MLEGEGFVSAYCALTWRVAVADDELLVVLFCWLVVHYNCIRPLSFRLSVFFSVLFTKFKCHKVPDKRTRAGHGDHHHQRRVRLGAGELLVYVIKAVTVKL